MVQYTSAPEVSLLIGPPLASSFVGSAVVRSGLAACQVIPESRLRNTRSPQT